MGRPSRALRRGAVVGAVLGMVLLWIYAFSGLGAQAPADRLDDPSFALRAESLCREARRELDGLPHVTHESPPGELADNIGATAAILGEMVDGLRRLPPGNDRDARLVGLWLTDWETHVGDLEAYADSVRAEGYHPFAETDREGEPLSQAMDNLARNNDMPSCEAP
jgi:hypothetical protein